MSPPASLSFKGQATKQATVKWFIRKVSTWEETQKHPNAQTLAHAETKKHVKVTHEH